MKTSFPGLLILMVVLGWWPQTALGQQPDPLQVECPTNQTVWTCGTNAVVVYPAPSVSGGDCRGTNVVRCVPSSGSLFSAGTTTVICTVTNSCGERATCTFTVTVNRDTTPPTIQCPTNMFLEICGTNPVPVFFPLPVATDNVSPSVTVTCMPASGSSFPVGTTAVSCAATDDCTNRNTCTFTVTVSGDGTPPTIQCPTNIVVWTCSRDAIVTYPAPNVSDDRDPNPDVACDPPSGSLFAAGTTLVTCEARDDCTNRSSCTFTITVNVDTTPPVIECPSNITVSVCGTNPAPVSWPAPNAFDDHSRSVTVVCTPVSGSLFAMGTTAVTCVATDDCTNRSTCTFTVTVNGDGTPPTIQCPTNISVWLCSTSRPSVTCPTPSSTPIRPASVGNGLFYAASVEDNVDLLELTAEMTSNKENGFHPIHVNAYRGSDFVDFAAAWVQDDDSAFLHGHSPAAAVWQLQVAEQAQDPWRPISLSGFKLNAAETRYAVAYLNDGAAFPWRLILDRDFNQYQTEIEALAALGYRPICVSGYSYDDQNARFSGIFVKDGLTGANWVTSHGIPEAGYQQWIDQWWDQGFRPVSLSAYTVGLQTFFTAVMVRLPGSGTVVASHGITRADFLNLNAQWTSVNNPHGEIFRPVVVAAYRSQFQGGVKRYAAVWCASAPRTFMATGNAVPSLQAFDDAMETFMKGKAINAGTLCVAKDGEIKLHRGYTWAPAEFERTQPCSRLRMASSSKALTAVAVMKLLEGNYITGMKGGGLQALTLDTPVFQINGMPDLPLAYGTVAQQITIRQLLQHRAGWDRKVWEPLYSDLTVAAALNKDVPVSRADMIKFMTSPSLWPMANNPASVGYVNFPGAQSAYSNFGFSILAELIEVISGQAYEDFVRQNVLLPVGANRTRLGRTARLLALSSPDEVTYTAGYNGDPAWYVSDPNYNPNVPGNVSTQSRVGANAEPGAPFPTTAYGRYNIHTIDAAGGWIGTSDDLVRLLASCHSYDPANPNTDTPLLEWGSLYEMWTSPANTFAFPELGDKYVLGWQQKDLAGNVSAHYHGGNIDGGLAIICRRSDGISFVALFSREAGGGAFTALNNVANTIANWPLDSDEAIVNYPAPSVSDNQDPNPTVICNPPSGSPFPVGTTQVTCQATDDCTNRSSCTFTVTVKVDDSPPVIECPDSILTFSCDRNGKVVTYPVPTATDNATPNPVVICNPPSGSQFPIGETDVTCVALDACTNRAICKFSIAVRPDPPPILVCPEDIRVQACTASAIVAYPTPAAIDNDPAQPGVTCAPPSGSVFPAGSTLVTCEATDACGNHSECTFTVTVESDTTPPTIQCPADVVAFTCNPNGTQVQYPSPTANDDKDRNPTVACTPPSGSVFPIGPTMVTCEATDSCTNRSQCTFTVTVETDTTPPVIQCPTNIVAGTCTSNAVVNFPNPTAMDDKDRDPTVICVPPSGSVFPLGNTVVHCDAIDDCTNRSTCLFTVTVVTDTVPPFIDCPSDRTNVACSASGVAVGYPLPEVSDNFDPTVSRNCLPPSGSVFPVGTTEVKCTAEDDCNNRSQCTFNITVVHDTSPPVLVCSNIVMDTCSAWGGTVFYHPTATDDHDNNVTITCVPPHNQAHTFPIGISMVHCEAKDNCGNTDTCTFTVTVKGDTSLPGSDLDQNGLSDIWQIHFQTGALLPGEDTDGDGMSNAGEAVAGTDPRNAEGHVNWYPVTYDGPVYQSSWSSVEGKLYEIQSTADLTSWADFGPPRRGSGGILIWRIDFSDPAFPELLKGHAFFRLQVRDVDEDQDGITAWEESIIGTSDQNPATFGMPGGDRTYAEQWIIQNGPASAGKLREVTVAHLGGSPEGPTQTRLVTAAGTGGFIQLSSWTINAGSHQPVHLQDAPMLEGFDTKLHVLEPPESPSLTINLVVHGRIREDGNLWLTVYRLTANGSFTELSTLGYGANARVQILDFAMAHRALSNPSGVEAFQLVTPVIASPAPFDEHLRLLTWSIDPNTGALTATFDSGDLNHTDTPGGGGGSVQIRHQEGSSYVVSYWNSGSDLSSWFFEVPNSGIVIARGGEASGRDIRGTANVLVPAQQVALETLTPNGFLTALLGETCNVELLVWEKRSISCDAGCFFRPFIITTNTADLLAGNGVQVTLPKVTDARDGTGDADEYFGKALAVGDFNGDGYQDVAIGTPGENGGAGAVDVMYGSVAYLKGSNADEHWVQGSDGVFGEQEPGDAFGSALAVGDFDKDGFDDLVIGIPGEDLDNNTQQAAGGVQILRGSFFGLVAHAFWSQDTPNVVGEAQTGDNFGAALAVGDFNGDTHLDLAIGSPFEDIESAGAIAAGAVNILYGSGSGLTTDGNVVLHQDIFSIIDDAESGDWFGRALAAGDFNDDGRDDLVIAAPGESLGVIEGAGVVHILYGADNGFNVFTFMISQDEFLPPGGDIQGTANFYDYFGWSLAVGDFNGDGHDDLAIGNPFDEENGTPFNAGTVNVLLGSPNGLVVAGNQLVSQHNMEGAPEAEDEFGYSLATADFNGDLRADLVVGARGEAVNDNAVPGAGATHLIFGAAQGLTGAGDRVFWQGNDIGDSAETNDHFGASVAAGDLNGDGLQDLVIGVPDENENDDNRKNSGAIHVLKGTAEGPTVSGDFVWTQGIQRKVRALLVDAIDEQANGLGAGKLFEQMPPNETTNVHAASVTKCMTLLLTVEALLDPASTISLDDPVTISKLAADTGGSFMGDEPGDENDHPLLENDVMPLRLLMYGMMVESCNKASRAIAEHVAGNFDDFVARMNQKATNDLGMVNTHYSHPAHGGVTTPQDLVTLWLYAWQYQLFRQFASANITWGECGWDANMNQKCYFLQKTPYYPGVDGWKGGNVGWSVDGYPVPFCTSCLLGQATRLDRSLIVALQQSDDTGKDSGRLFDYGYKVLFTPDYRGSAMLNIPNITDFAVRKITDTLAITAAIDGQNNLRLHTWQTVAGIGQVSLLNSASLTYDTLAAGTHYVHPTFLDMTRLPSLEAQGDYVSGRLQSGRLHLDLWRVAPQPGY